MNEINRTLRGILALLIVVAGVVAIVAIVHANQKEQDQATRVACQYDPSNC